MKPCIAILREYNPSSETHIATDLAIAHSHLQLASEIERHWVSTEDINDSLFETYSGIWVAPGSPYKNIDKTKIWIKRFGRSGTPVRIKFPV